ncbi:tRNA (adenosine(37)-N6)-threonylcarbamoyltransferase complex dimerization subunit type 1 TsaB [Paenibacillus sp. CAA11]|uniref:tRNA (adenosine(37)-N6)-threonylcarbamoyltransferase complex dimerization subunit type 1 TsaB n=1 Tax=Paenibacillus sp. CAA11 TaxID=1532905 RepID=UPI000D34F64C|nr:tRNA (adenosine(37)-N6)-threonylcarbamoyltransferase complex dimerization subunit type 1 TsaB [Paenibacillus sp. CAA11]AWB43625.1 tRNA (adenosine(37)-N6)-threonylcarbamoyltransferase complex dimerization subunit type 1 TsaB [Paenibacillus sp. CAA11]
MNKNNVQAAQRFLVMDTATATLVVAVMERGRVLAEHNMLAERGHAEYLLPACADVLQAAGITRSELTGIAVGVGPGSYTGIRIAVTAAKTLAWSLGLPVAGISSLEALALGAYAKGAGLTAADLEPAVEGGRGAAPGPVEWVVPLMDARRGQVFTALFEAAPGSLTRRLEPDGIRLMADWTEALGALWSSLAAEDRPSKVTLAGDIEKHAAAAEALRPLLGEALCVAPYAPEGAFAGLLGAARLLRGEQDDVHSLLPNYTQLAEAEANRLRQA